MAVCVVGKESELVPLVLSLSSVMTTLPTWRVKIYSPASLLQAVRQRLLPVVGLSRGYARVEFATLEPYSDEDFTRNSSTHVLWGTHRPGTAEHEAALRPARGGLKRLVHEAISY